MAENTDDPLTDSQKPSTTTTITTTTTTTTTSTTTAPPNPGPEKAESNTSSYRAPRASWRQQGLITQPETGTPARNCLTEQSLLWTLDKPLAVSSGRKKRLPLSCDRFPQVCDCYLLLSVIGSTYRICLLSTLICLLCELAAPPCATEDSETLESLRIVLPQWKSSVLLTALRKGFPPITLLASYETRRILKGRRSRA
ncbi:uncharacterized protein LOC115354874 isoform X1 [Myripristis murdjan]|uniref:uncharacterized protein LOC115354874 isoform X1 n=1 Tax=Myripristis murdjan TaxID=586833 RepID=UPI0011762D70|nr:chemokine-like protein TAFA-5 isoform X1 [Myripristis murdjan]